MAEVVVEVRVEGIAEAVQKLGSLEQKIRRRIVNAGVRAGLKVLLQQAKAAAPVRTGGLRASLKVSSVRLDRATGTVSGQVRAGETSKTMQRKGQTAFYAHMVTGGTRAHEIKPKTARALAFGGRFAASVQHPGAAANPFMEQAMGSAFGQAIEAFRKACTQKLQEEIAK